MQEPQTQLQQRISAGKSLLLAEISPPCGGSPAALRDAAQRLRGKVHAVGISDNRDHVAMSSLAAATVVVSEGIEPILHLVTRDRNRIALVSEALGAQALGIRNILCTSGTHPSLGPFRAAKSVFDIDPVQLLQTYCGLAEDGSLVGESCIAGAGPFCLGGVAAPYADPMELQLVRLAKKAAAGAQFLITQPVFDLDRFGQWWQEATRRGLHEKVAIVAGIEPLTDGAKAIELADKRPRPRIPQAILDRLGAAADASAQRAAGIAVAVETIQKLTSCKGLRGFQVYVDGDVDAALEVIDSASLGAN